MRILIKGEELAVHMGRNQAIEFLSEVFSVTYVLISYPLAWVYGQAARTLEM